MRPFFTLCLETAKAETRSITIQGMIHAPPEIDLLFDENYCDETGCDCRRVLLIARVCDDYDRILATINYGWEPAAYYQAWTKSMAPEMAAGMSGASLEPFGKQSRHAGEILQLAEEHLFSDPEYVSRLQRHYLEFKAKLPRRSKSHGWRRAPRPGGAGRKKR